MACELAIPGLERGADVATSDAKQAEASLEKVALSPKPQKDDFDEVDAKIDEKEPKFLLKFLLCAVAALEGADNLLIGATMFALIETAGIEFTDLIYLGGLQAVCTNIAGPLWGMLADNRTISRRNILILGSLGQGMATVGLALTTDLNPMIILRGVNGIMLASLRPISNGVVADCTSDSLRGKIFGQVQSSMVGGMLFTSVIATPIARMSILGVQGWRVAYVLVGSLSILVCLLLVLCFVDPVAKTQNQRRGFRAMVDEIKSLLHFFTIPTFSIMIMQGIFGTIPWGVLGLMTMFFQLSGLSDGEATILQTESLVVGIFGNTLGGIVADALARRFGYHGRPLNAQFTVAVGLPLITAMFYWITPGEGNIYIYFVLLFAWALLGCWAQSGTNFPILCEIVPSAKRCRILAWECCLENTVAGAITPFVVAAVSTHFGYSFSQDNKDDPVARIESAKALGKSMTLITIVPGICCFCVYSILHCTYARDVKRVEELNAQAAVSKHEGVNVTASKNDEVDL